MTPAKLSSLLNAQAESVCRHLLPNGRKVRNEWVCGDPYGTEGNSFKIVIEGDKVGVGSDFAGNENFGDFLDLWMVNQSVDLREAMARACSFLNVVNDGEDSRPKREYSRPERPKSVSRFTKGGEVHTYLRSRGLTDEVLEEFRINETHRNDGAWIVFPYLRDGKHINTKYLKVERPDGKKVCHQEKNPEPCLYGWDALDKKYPNDRRVVICEGEIDCMTWHQCGIPALSIPNGAGSGEGKHDWIFSDYDRLDRFDHIYLSMDMDDAGKKAEVAIIKRLGEDRCRRIELPYKDANECFAHGISDFRKYVLSAKSNDPIELKSAGYFRDEVMDKFYPKPGSFKGMKSPWKGLNESLVFNHQELVVWTGFSASGKSALLNQVSIQGMLDGERFCIASFEMSAKSTLWRMVRQIVGERLPTATEINRAIDWLEERCWIFNIKGTAKKDRMLEVFKYAMRRYDIRQFVVDSFTKCGIDDDDKAGAKVFIEQLCDFADQFDSTVHLIAHQRKPYDEDAKPGKHGVRGSSVITDEAHTVISVWRPPQDKEETPHKYPLKKSKQEPVDSFEKPDTIIRILKSREEGIESEHKLYYDADSIQFHEQRQVPVHYLNQYKSTETDTF